MTRFAATFVLILACFRPGAAADDSVKRFGSDTDWTTFVLENCEITEADVRIIVSVRADWLGREVVEMPLRLQRRKDSADAGAIYLDPITMTSSETEGRSAVTVQIVEPDRRSFQIRVTAREGGQEMAGLRIDTTVKCHWLAQQKFRDDGVDITVVIGTGPAEPPADDS